MDPISLAIASLELEIQLLGIPRDGTQTWWTLRAKSMGLSLLRTLRQRGLTDVTAAEEFRKDLRKSLVQDIVVVDTVGPDQKAVV